MHRDHIIAITSGMLALAGVVLGTVLSAYFTQRQFDQQLKSASREKLISKRIEVVEQCVRARADITRAKMIMDLVELDSVTINAALQSKDPRLSPTDRKTTYDSYEHQREFAELRTNYATCIQMATVFFGPKTKAAALEMNKVERWYENVNSKELVAFTDAMLSEVNHIDAEP